MAIMVGTGPEVMNGILFKCAAALENATKLAGIKSARLQSPPTAAQASSGVSA